MQGRNDVRGARDDARRDVEVDARDVAITLQAGRCPRPRQVRCPDGRWRAARCKRRDCPSCGLLWAGDCRVKLLANIREYAGDVAIVTVTAPGRDVLPYGNDGQAVERAAARRWNRQARHEWRKLHRKASQRAARHAHRHGGRWSVVARSWEFQRRGVLHVHVVVPMGTALERLASHVYVDALEELRHRHGFGFVDRGRAKKRGGLWIRALEAIPQERAARYVAKYLGGWKRGRLEISATVGHPDVPGHVIHVRRELTRKTGVTMRELRARRACFRRFPGLVQEGYTDPARWMHRLECERRCRLPGEAVGLIVAHWLQHGGPPPVEVVDDAP